MKQLACQYKEFYKKNKRLLMYCVILVLICFGSRVFSSAISVDTDTMLCNPNSTLNWLQIGRWGLIVTKYVFHTMWFNTYIAGVMCFVTIVVFLMTFSFFFDYVYNGEKKVNYFLFAGLFITHPVFACQWFFKLQEFEVAMSILYVAFALICTFYWMKSNDIKGLIIAVIFMVWSFASYETNIVLYIAGAMLGFLLTEKKEMKEEVRKCARLIGSFLIAFLIRTVISEVFFTDAVQVENSFMWGNTEWKNCLFNIAKNIGIVLLGYKIFNVIYAVLLILTLLIWILSLKKRKEKDGFRYFVFAVFLLVPFSLSVMTGNMPVYRSLYILPFVVGGAFMYLYTFCERNHIYERGFKIVLIVIASIFVVEQCQTTLRLWYTDDVRYEQDQAMLDQVLDDMSRAGIDATGKPVVFYGKWEAPLNPSCNEKVEIFAYSYFDMYSDYAPYYLFSSINIQRLAQINGYSFQSPSEDQVLSAGAIAQDMPSYPSEGYIKEENGIVIVKMAENQYQ